MMHSERDTQINFRREFVWRFSKFQLSDDDISWAKHNKDELLRLSVEPLVPLLRYVWLELDTNVRLFRRIEPEFEPLAEAVSHICDIHRRAHTQIIAAQDELFGAFENENLFPLVIKGAAMRPYLPSPPAMNDLDILVRDFDEAWKIVQVAEGLGYELKKVRFRMAGPSIPISARLHGYANLYRCETRKKAIQADWDLERVRTLDLHVGAFYSTGEGILITDIISRAKWAQIAAHRARVPRVEDMLLIECAHLLRHGTLAMRGINRIALLISGNAGVIDAQDLALEAERNDLTPILRASLLCVQGTFPHLREASINLRESLKRPGPLSSRLESRLAEQRYAQRYGVGSFTSTALQATYIAATYKRQFNRRAPYLESFKCFLRLYATRTIYPRAHRRHTERVLGWLNDEQRSVMYTRLDCTKWEPNGGWQTMPEKMKSLDGEIGPWRQITRTSFLFSEGTSDEVLLTPTGAFTSSNYDGSLDGIYRRRCYDCAEELRSKFGVKK